MKRLSYLLSIVTVSILVSCYQSEGNKNLTTIKISLSDTSIKKVYLVNAYDWEKRLDSTTKDQGFVLKTSISNQPELYSLTYINSSGHIKKLNFKNNILSPDSIKYIIDAFIPSKSEIKISSITNSEYYAIDAGMENESFYATQMMNFGYLEGSKQNRSNTYEIYSNIIRKYPKSDYLLSKINESKTVLTKNELSGFLTLFDKNSDSSMLYKKLLLYAKGKQNDFGVVKNFKLKNSQSNSAFVYDSSKKVNVIVLWASWCGPCRREIPVLKNIYQQYKSSDLLLTSISVDDSIKNWTRALSEEKMEWPQLIVTPDTKARFEEEFSSSAIPDILFLDKKGLIKARYIGVNNEQTYTAVIDSLLKGQQ